MEEYNNDHPFQTAANFLNENAKSVEENAGIELIKQQDIEKIHTRLDFARSLRMAAKLLENSIMGIGQEESVEVNDYI